MEWIGEMLGSGVVGSGLRHDGDKGDDGWRARQEDGFSGGG